MQPTIDRRKTRRRVRHGIRRKVSGTASRPRLAVYRSLKHIYVQAVDDEAGRTLASAGTRGNGGGGNIKAAEQVGRDIAQKLKESGVETVVFDRGGFLYHGRVKALADGARKEGLKF